jgi:hypothetical protein
MINDWWNNIVQPGLNLVADFTLGVLGFDNFDQLSNTVYGWFMNKFKPILDFLGFDTNPQERDLSAIKDIRADRSGYEFALQQHGNNLGQYQDIIGYVDEIDKLLAGGTAEEFSTFAQSMIDLSKTEGGKGLFSQATIDTLKTIDESGVFSQEEIQALAGAIQADFMNAIIGIATSFGDTSKQANDAREKVNAFLTSLHSLPNTVDVKVRLVVPTGINSWNDVAPNFVVPSVKKAKGDWNVPYDNYPALLHRNEMVLTASQARQYREGFRGNNYDSEAIASAVREAVSDIALVINNDTGAREIGNMTSQRVNRNIGKMKRINRYAYGG